MFVNLRSRFRDRAMSTTKSSVWIAVLLLLFFSISIFITFSDSQSHRLQLPSFSSLPRSLSPLSNPFSPPCPSAVGAVVVDHRPPPVKVFMYDLPRRFNFEMIDHRPESEADRGVLPPWPKFTGIRRQHSVEYWLTASLMMNATQSKEAEMEVVRVLDGDQADVFFVPFFSSLSFNTHGRVMTDPETQIDRQLQLDLLDLLKKSKYWQRSAGRDHIVPMQHPNAFRFLRDQLNASILVIADFGRYPRNVSYLSKDVVAPYVHVVDSFTDDNTPDPFESRPTLLFFRGRTVRKDEGTVRMKLAKILTGYDDVHYENSVATGEGIKASTQGMRSSKFCLHPAGDTPSSCRLFDAIASHCVPVIVSDHIELPFEDELDYSDFSLFFSVKEALQPNLLVSKLREVKKERWVEMWARLKNISHHFEFQHPPKPGDGINMLWRQVRHKLPSARLAVHRGRRLKIPDWWRRRR